MHQKVAVIDLGTNTFHLLIGEWRGDQYAIIHRDRAVTKVGMGSLNTGIITEAATGRAINALRKFRETINEFNVNQTLALATSAFRNATNGVAIAGKILQETGIDIKIISGDEEAKLIYLGVTDAVKLGNRTGLIVDIGGGSVEFIIGNGTEIFWKQSFEIGAQRLLEKYNVHDPLTPSERSTLNTHFHQVLSPLMDQIHKYSPEILVGSSGTFDTLSDIYGARNGIAWDQDARETPLTVPAFHEIFKDLLTKNRAARMLVPGMIEMRVDMIVVACCLIDFLFTQSAFNQVRVSTYSLKEGVLASLKTGARTPR